MSVSLFLFKGLISSPVKCNLSYSKHGYSGVGLCVTKNESDGIKDELSFLDFWMFHTL